MTCLTQILNTFQEDPGTIRQHAAMAMGKEPMGVKNQGTAKVTKSSSSPKRSKGGY